MLKAYLIFPSQSCSIEKIQLLLPEESKTGGDHSQAEPGTDLWSPLSPRPGSRQAQLWISRVLQWLFLPRALNLPAKHPQKSSIGWHVATKSDLLQRRRRGMTQPHVVTWNSKKVHTDSFQESSLRAQCGVSLFGVTLRSNSEKSINFTAEWETTRTP